MKSDAEVPPSWGEPSSDELSLYDDAAFFDDEDAAPPDASAEIVDLRAVLRAAGHGAAPAEGDEAGSDREAEDLSWQDYALCNQSDPEAFFPEKGGSTRQAKSVCRRCPVTDACLQYALKYRERHGIWGGKSEQQRHEILKSISDTAEAGLGRAG